LVKIRLMRVGKRKQPSYRVVVADSRSPRDGRIIEAIGHYHPRQEPSEISVNGDRAVYWLKQGAQPSSAVRKLLQISGAWAEFSGEAAPTPVATRTTRAASVKATPAASVADEGQIADLPEAEDQSGAAPEAEVDPQG
jgi:small subunit ribosomal protein S16